MPIVLASLWGEARLLGWERSSAKKLFECRTQSVRTDLFYLVLNASNLHIAAGLALTFGLGVEKMIRERVPEVKEVYYT